MLLDLLLHLLRNEDFDKGWKRCNFYTNSFRWIYASFCLMLLNEIIRSYAFPLVNFNAVWIVRTAISSSTCFLICFLNLLRNEDFATDWNCCNFYANFFSLNLCYVLVSMKWNHFKTSQFVLLAFYCSLKPVNKMMILRQVEIKVILYN